MSNNIALAKQSIIEDEGFSSTAYPDPLTGNLPYTFGHGLTYITKDESSIIVGNRCYSIVNELNKEEWFTRMDSTRQSAIINMAFQIGVGGLKKFKKTIGHFNKYEYSKASSEMLDSKWAKQTPERAKKISEIIKTGQIKWN